MNADPTPAAGGLTPDTSLAPDVAASAEPAAPPSERGDDTRPASAREALSETMADRVTWDDGTEYIAVEDAARIIAARTEAADRELARVTAAVEDGLREVERAYDDAVVLKGQHGIPCWAVSRDRLRDALRAARAALSSAGTTALDDLLDRERAKAARGRWRMSAREALAECATCGRPLPPEPDGIKVYCSPRCYGVAVAEGSNA